MKLQFSNNALTTFDLVKKNSPERAELIKTILNYIYIYIGLKTILEMNINHIKEK